METNDKMISDMVLKKDIKTDSNEPKFNFDRLQMYFSYPHTVKCNIGEITIYEPSVGDIIEYGEQQFYSMLNIFVGNPTLYRVQLWDVGIDWIKISDYELFCMLIGGAKKESTKLLFGDVDLQSFGLYKKIVDDKEVRTLYSNKLGIEIEEFSYKHIAEYLRLMFNIYPKTEKIKGKSERRFVIDEEKTKMQIELKKYKNTSKSMLLPLVSSCINHPGFKYKSNELKKIGIFEFMDSVQRLQIYENTAAFLNGRAANIDYSKNFNKESLNFMRDIY